jgi:hypothetical protein
VASYRYLLARKWDGYKPVVLFVMLNPSTADNITDDATIRSCVRLAARLGYGALEVVNLFACRATDPKHLPKASIARGPDNPRIVEAAIARHKTVICAWGAHPFAAQSVPWLRDVMALHKRQPYCFGVTKQGAPRHPLYVKTETPLQPYEWRT